MDEEYFSTENLSRLAEIEEHMVFIENTVTKYRRLQQNPNKAKSYGFSISRLQSIFTGLKERFFGKSKTQPQDSDDEWSHIQLKLDRIKEKMGEKKLNISVIGEFSTGKSTFINALMGKELLVSSALQGTTVASTIIDYDKRYRLRIEYLEGQKPKEIPCAAFGELKKQLKYYTTTPEVAKTLKTVWVYLPSEILKNEFRIIDTPGTNVTEAWHEDVTVRSLKNDSDLSIVLISALRPVSESMMAFTEKNLTSIIPQCIFIVTKLDQVREKERKGILKYCKMKLEQGFNLKNAVVLPYVSPFILGSRDSDSEDYGINIKDSDKALVELSLETEKALVEHTINNKTLVVTKKLTALIDDIYDSISGNMKVLSAGYEERLELLNRSKKTDLSEFINGEKYERLRDFDSGTKELAGQLEEELYTAFEEAKEQILKEIDELTSIDNLKNYIDKKLGERCWQQAEEIIGRINIYYSVVRELFEKEMNYFNIRFKENYENLDIIPVDMTKSQYSLPADIKIETANISSAAKYVANKLSGENMAFFGGAAAGAAIGTAIAPGIGTVIGGIVGLIAGGAAAPDTATVLRECKDKLMPQLESYYNSISNKMTSALDQYIGQIRGCLNNEMDGYELKYKREIDRLIEEQNRQSADVIERLRELEADRNQLNNKKTKLESVIRQFNNFGRKEE